MAQATLSQAIAYLRPGVDFADVDGTLARVRWDTPGVVPPTQQEVDAAIAAIDNPPIVVSRLRLKLALADREELATVDVAVAAAGATAQLYWAEAVEFESDHPLVLQIGAAIGLDAAGVRALFAAARDRDA